MKRAIGLLTMTLLAVGCGSSKPAGGEASQPAGQPSLAEARSCIAVYLTQFGWQNVELTTIAERPHLPSGPQASGEAWAYTFSANYTNVLAEHTISENWVAVIERNNGQPIVKSCFDNSNRLVSGNHGNEMGETASLAPQPQSDTLPPIVAPKP
jgi:hypothetical protein